MKYCILRRGGPLSRKWGLVLVGWDIRETQLGVRNTQTPQAKLRRLSKASPNVTEHREATESGQYYAELVHGPRKDHGGGDAGSSRRLFNQDGGGVTAAQKVSCNHSRREFFHQGTPGDPSDL